MKMVQAMIKPAAAMCHESMEILAKERIRRMNIGYLHGRTLSQSGAIGPNDRRTRTPLPGRGATEDLDPLQLVPHVNPAIADLSSR